jgi:hypothetical protein
MNEHGKTELGSSGRGERARSDMAVDRRGQPEASATLGLAAALEGGHVDLKAAVLFLAARLSEAECRLAHLGRAMDRIKRRVSEAESQLAGLASRSSQHEDSLRMMCAVLKELDDPYGFGAGLDEQIAYDGPDWTTEEEA